MQVVILCGGEGTRIADVSDRPIPKPMVPIGNQPILWHIMSHYAAFGYDEFILCLGYRGDKIKEYFLHFDAMAHDLTVSLGERSGVTIHRADGAGNWTVTLAETGAKTKTAGRLKQVEKYLKGDHFMLTYGDGVSDVDLHALEAFHLESDALLTLTGVIPPGRFGELDLDGHQVTRVREKPERSSDRPVNGGFMVINRKFIGNYLAGDVSSIMLEDEPFEQAALDGRIVMRPHHGFWHPMDTRRDWIALNTLWDSGDAPWRAWD